MFPQLCKTFCVSILITHVLFSRTNQKNVLQKEIKDSPFEVYLGNQLGNQILDSRWLIIENDLQEILCVVLEFFYQRVWIVFRGFMSWPNSVKELSPAQNNKSEQVEMVINDDQIWFVVVL